MALSLLSTGYGVDDYGYINARIRAMMGQLLKPRDYEKLLGEETPENLKVALKDTPYAGPIARHEASLQDPVEIVGRALVDHLAEVSRKLLKISDGEPRLCFSVLLGRWDVHNVKALIRGRMRGASDPSIQRSFMPAGVLDPVRLEQLLRDRDPLKILDRLATWGLQLPFVVGRDLIKAVNEGRLEDVELYLDRSYFQWAFERLSPRRPNTALVRELLRSLVDVRNVMAVLMLLKAGLRPRGRVKYLEGGRLKASDYRALEDAESLEQALDRLREGPLGRYLRDTKTTALETVERALESAVLHQAFQMRFADPLGIGVGIAFLFAKETEIINLRTILYGLEFGLRKAEIRQDLVFLVAE